jgi:hypothetical protein
MNQTQIGLILWTSCTVILIILLIFSLRRKKKKWLIIFLSFLLVWSISASVIMLDEFIKNFYYPFSEITIKNEKYYREGKLCTGVSSYLNKKDSVVLKIKEGVLINRTIYLTLDKKIEISDYFFESGERYSRYIYNNAESISEAKLWYMIIKDSNRNLDDFILLYGKPIKIEKENNRTFYSFLIEKESSECTDKRDFVGKVSFEKPFFAESGCTVNQKLITDSKENILSKIKDKYFVCKSYGSIIGTLEMRYDKTFILSTKILGGSASEGTWEIYDGDDVGQANIILYPPSAQVAAGNIAKEIYLVVDENDLSIRVRGSDTVYELKK